MAGLAGGLAAHNAAEAVTSDPKALGGANVSLSLGFSKSSSSGASHDETVIGSTVRGHDIKLIASGAGAASTIRVTGSDVVASNALLLSADGGIIAEAATERDTVSGTSKSVGAGVGVSLGIGGAQAGPRLNASFSSAKGAYAGEEVSHRGTVLAGGGTTKVVTSGTLTLDGAQLVGNRVEGDVGHLVLASRQDTATYSASHKSVGASVSHNPASAKPSPARLLQNRTGVRRPLAD
ncbi:hemagglutinin repeat-containing protein [Croceibacterium sp. LX-88]|uniref:Hemagglutinin repeat-containing protein n=1 Tax=Croceibacterium selenioxidans TaxID=2838833 RepID=A0ABS5W4R0_9SPHN|nr:hemagglutinin repeat-containing protein [Croceibacterium selenioxidans]